MELLLLQYCKFIRTINGTDTIEKSFSLLILVASGPALYPAAIESAKAWTSPSQQQYEHIPDIYSTTELSTAGVLL